ncbi:hypothetical protein GALL_521710 [mine drainage metagenome]|uniref:Uncharacterized protein n=1 Tax=mine drainage metagenome TaxID=410659 RepID=A0A1J5PRR0_9ZZZZ
MIHRAARLLLIRDQHVLAVQIQHAKLLRLAMRHRGVAVVQQGVPTRQNGAMHHACPRHAMCRRLDNLQLLHHRIAHPLHRRNPRRRGRNHPVEIAKRVQQAPRQGLYILPGDCAEQHQLQQLIIRHSLRSPFHKAGAQPFAMVFYI